MKPRIPVLLVLLCCAVILGVRFWPVHAQGAAGFTKIASVTTGTTYTDGTCPDGATCYYQVTALNGTLESGPSNTVSAAIPATGTHTVTLNWKAATTGVTPTSYNVYQGQAPVPPVVSPAVTN